MEWSSRANLKTMKMPLGWIAAFRYARRHYLMNAPPPRLAIDKVADDHHLHLDQPEARRQLCDVLLEGLLQRLDIAHDSFAETSLHAYARCSSLLCPSPFPQLFYSGIPGSVDVEANLPA